MKEMESDHRIWTVLGVAALLLAWVVTSVLSSSGGRPVLRQSAGPAALSGATWSEGESGARLGIMEDDVVSWTVDQPSDTGALELTIRYSRPDDRQLARGTLTVYRDGVEIGAHGLDFPTTGGDWDSFGTVYAEVPVSGGGELTVTLASQTGGPERFIDLQQIQLGQEDLAAY